MKGGDYTDIHEIALQLTLKAMDAKLIEYNSEMSCAVDVAAFYNTLIDELCTKVNITDADLKKFGK